MGRRKLPPDEFKTWLNTELTLAKKIIKTTSPPSDIESAKNVGFNEGYYHAIQEVKKMMYGKDEE